MRSLKKFRDDQSGTVTLDWIALTAGMVIISIGIVYSSYTHEGDAPLNKMINAYNAHVQQHADNIKDAVPTYNFFE